MNKDAVSIASALHYASNQLVIMDEELRNARAAMNYHIERGQPMSLEDMQRIVRRIDKALA